MTEIHSMTISQLSTQLREKHISAEELTRQFLDRSQVLNEKLNIWVTLDPEIAIAQARKCDEQIAKGNFKSPLLGIPIGVKDIYFTEDMKTTCCSPIFEDFSSGYDAEPVRLLRQSGSVIMGKTVTTQFACGDPSPTKNPWNLQRTPGGSSSGSAAGLAAGLFTASLGSQTAGSVLRPAAYNGVVGFKPTHGLVSRFGVYPVAMSLDTMGWFTKSVADAATLLQCMAGYDERDEGSKLSEIPLYSKSESEKRAPKIGLVEQYYFDDADPETVSEINKLADKLSDAGAEIKSANVNLDFRNVLDQHRIIMTSEGSHTHRDNFLERPDDYAPEVRGVIETGLATSAATYVEALSTQRHLTAEVEKTLDSFDVLLAPTAISGAPTPETTGQPAFQAPWTMAGVPAISLPYTLDSDGLPLGVQIIGSHFQEYGLFSSASWLEEVIGFSEAPELV